GSVSFRGGRVRRSSEHWRASRQWHPPDQRNSPTENGTSEDALSRAKRLLFGVPINIRHHVTPPVGQDCGVFATGVTVCATLAPGATFWDLARQVARDIRSHIDAGDHLILVPRAWQAYSMLMPGVQPDEDGTARFAAYVERRPPPNAPFSLTNLGRLAVDSTFGPLHIEAMGLLVGVSALSRLVATVMTLDDVMVFHVAGLAPLISDDRLGRIADRAVAELHAAVGV
ncbi:MAG: hypothetical protein JXA69_05925, partial [Phycisphaerae bacterium]|nr:hypothetical protein [Phycisphaerae bacterium]